MINKWHIFLLLVVSYLEGRVEFSDCCEGMRKTFGAQVQKGLNKHRDLKERR